MKSYPLDGTWTLRAVPPRDQQPVSIVGFDALPGEPVSATVPGNVEPDLARAGIIDFDPYIGENVLKLAQYEHWEWWYRREFDTPADQGHRTVLRFEGLDTIADVWLNGDFLGRRENMFIAHEFDVTGMFRSEQPNEVIVRLSPAVRRATDYRYEDSVGALPSNMEQLYLRKAPHMFGWDIMPRIVSAGIWRNVALDVHGSHEIADVVYRPYDVSERGAGLHVRWNIDAPPEDWSRLSVHVTGSCGDSRFEGSKTCRFVSDEINIGIENPRLWWPAGYGAADLYDVTFELLLDGKAVDRRADRIGIRSIRLDRTDITEDGRPGEFRFVVNGEPILVKGTNWVPADAFHSRDAERIPSIMEHMADVGCNMVRCWGGNVYEDHLFYDECDRLGIMVWQDFSMACGRYPQDAEFAERLRVEAEAVVRKLRNHTCIAMWAGDNECDESYFGPGLDPNSNCLTRDVLPEVLRRLDPWRPYLPSSPYHAPEVVARHDAQLMPERHLWGPRDYYKSSYYTESRYHFVSEIGYHGCPNRSSLERFLSPDALWPWKDNTEWRIHAADTTPEPGPYAYRIELMAKQIGELFGKVPDELDDFILGSQISQAEAVKFFIEMTRLGKWRRTGVLWWNLIDGWPQFSDSVMDYYFGVKLAYHYIRRTQQPVSVMMREPKDWNCTVVLGNDSREAIAGQVTVTDAETGETVLECRAEAPPNTNVDIGRVSASRGTQRLFLIRWNMNGVDGGNHYMLGSPPFDLDRYRGWLDAIAKLPAEFDATTVGR